MEIDSEKYAIIDETLDEYIDILAKTIIQDYIVKNEEFILKILLDIYEGKNSNNLTSVIKNYILPKQFIDLYSADGFLESLNGVREETTRDHFKLLSISIENSALRNLDVHQNKTLNKKEAEELLIQIKRTHIEALEYELKKYDPDILLFVFYGIAGRLAVLSSMTVLKASNGPIVNNPLIENDPYSILMTLMSNMDENEILQTSLLIGTEKKINDILFNLVYKIYTTGEKEEKECYRSKIDIRRIYQLTYMVSTSILYLESNQLLYEQGQALVIKDWTLLQSGDFNENMLRTQMDIIRSDYREDIVKSVFKEYSKREGFCPDDLIQFALKSHKDLRGQIHLLTSDKEILKKIIIESTNVKDYGVNRFLDVLTLQKNIKDIAHSTNKLSVRPFLELNDGSILYSTTLLVQAFLMLEMRMLQQSFTTNHKLQKFISKNYDEAGIIDLAKVVSNANLPYLEHVSLDKINDKHIKDAFNIKGITKEFDLIFIKNKTFFIVEYKTWKISSYDITQVLKEQKKITRNIANHIKTIEIITSYPTEFIKLFGEEFNGYNNIELLMVFQNPTAFKYFKNLNDIKVFSPKQFKDFINN